MYIVYACVYQAIHGQWNSWSGWGSCNAICGAGNLTRTRTCTDPAPRCGGLSCIGPSTEVTPCNTHNCCK